MHLPNRKLLHCSIYDFAKTVDYQSSDEANQGNILLLSEGQKQRAFSPRKFIAKLLNRKKQFNGGFSLIELLTVISIIGILIAVATVSWSTAQQKARDSKRKGDLKTVQQAFELYFEDNGSYPRSLSGEISCDGINKIAWGTQFKCTNVYISQLPKDPTGTIAYHYEGIETSVGSGIFLKYQLGAALENVNDPERCISGCTTPTPPILPCNPNDYGPGGLLSYCVIQP